MFEKLISQIGASAVRHVFTSIGALLVADGLANQSDAQQLVGCMCWLATFGFSIWDKYEAKKKLTAAKTA
jgi:hypothetical protein